MDREIEPTTGGIEKKVESITTTGGIPLQKETKGVGRDHGRFIKGHKEAGPGNPYFKEIVRLRGYLLKCPISKQKQIADKLIEEAAKGSIAHMTLFFKYTLPPLAQTIDINQTINQIGPEEARRRVYAFFGIEETSPIIPIADKVIEGIKEENIEEDEETK